ncbi:prepilin-type N-terminal cleavage/methylation domain-containing protein [Candidatus Dojkabacteria bacterium]|nr:prepilin-type N-terminal cleavage/methylation domain-containing protein [Candidatus Dojkabacteria bacterium]
MKNKKGFSLVELLVAMAIIAVLISIAAYGIQIVQRNARNTKRRKVVQDLQLTIADFQTNNFSYPTSLSLSGCTVQLDGNNTAQEIRGFNSCSVYATGGECAVSTEETNENAIQICYDPTNLFVGVVLEGNTTGYVSSV